MSALIPSAHFPDDFFFQLLLLVFIRMVEVLQRVFDKSKSFSQSLPIKSENFKNEKIKNIRIFFEIKKIFNFFFVFDFLLHSYFGSYLLCFCLFNQLFLSFFLV